MQSQDDEHTLRVAGHGVSPAPLDDDAPFDWPHPPTGEGGAACAADGGAHRGERAGMHGRQPDDESFGWRDALIWCGIPVVVVLLIRIFLIGFYVIPSGSMLDTIEPGDRVVTTKLTPRLFDLQRGDIIVFTDPNNWLSDEHSGNFGGDYLIKRLIGLPGDVVECKGAGEPVTINGVAIDESAYLRPGVDPSAFPFHVEVSAGHVFVMGDNRASSADSRYHQDDGDQGLVPVSDVVGVAVARFWPLTRIGVLSGHHEVFDDVPDGTIG